MAKSIVEKIQGILDLEQDGIWGPKSQAALNKEIGSTAGEGNPVLVKIQKLLGVDADGFWGPKSQQAFNDARDGGGAAGGGSAGGFNVTASSFADLQDVKEF